MIIEEQVLIENGFEYRDESWFKGWFTFANKYDYCGPVSRTISCPIIEYDNETGKTWLCIGECSIYGQETDILRVVDSIEELNKLYEFGLFINKIA